jgi:lambda repressor-like predicted transcriptional regulator
MSCKCYYKEKWSLAIQHVIIGLRYKKVLALLRNARDSQESAHSLSTLDKEVSVLEDMVTKELEILPDKFHPVIWPVRFDCTIVR